MLSAVIVCGIPIAHATAANPPAWELPPTSLLASLTNRSLAKNCRQEVITGKKSDQLANLKPENLDGKLAERGAESSLWKLEVGRSRVFGIAQICDGCTIVCGCGLPQGWGIPTWL